MGQSDFKYTQTKKQYVFWSVFTSLVIDGFYAYFICVVVHYRNALRKEEEEEEAAEKAEKGEWTTNRWINLSLKKVHDKPDRVYGLK